MTHLLITTSRKPNQRTRSFAKDLASVLPDAFKINRGKKTLLELGLECFRHRSNYLFIIGERKGNPSIIRIYRLDKKAEYPLLKQILIFKISSVKLSREIHSSRVYGIDYMWINYDKCLTDNCFHIADLFIDIYRDRISKENYSIMLYLEEEDGVVFFKIYSRLGKICGPLFKINGVKKLDREV
ncbi:MAG: hypothetical protein QXX35_02185 [Desulfurococcaceae archaeon]